MALSGSVKVAATTEDDLIFSWAATQSAADNTSTVTWQTKLVAKYYGMIITSDSGYRITVGDQVFTGKANLSIGNNETKLLASGQVVIPHDAEGNGSFSFAFTHNFYITFGGVRIEEVSGSGQAVLDPIPRSSFPTAGDGILGQPMTLYTNRVADFTHTLTYEFGKESGIIAENVTDSCSWTPPLTLAAQIPGSPSGVARITCVTFDGTSQVGAPRQISVTLEAPEDMVPTVSALWQDTSGAQNALGTLVQNVSRLTVDVTGAGIYGSTVTSAAVSLSGKPYAGGILTESGTPILIASVTDSRGRVGVARYPLTVAAYAPPALTLNASRCLSDGTADDTGEFALVTVTGSVTDVAGENTADLTLTYGGITVPMDAAVGSFTTQVIIPADSTKTLAIQAELSDKLLQAERAMTLSTGYATLDLLAGGRGIAFGKSATREGFDCAMPAYFTGGISGITAGDVGAAPAGFGLGAGGTGFDFSQIDTLKANGWYAAACPNTTVNNISFHYAYMFVTAWDANACRQTLYPVGTGGTVLIRACVSGTWGEWESINPPMALGVEYRTTERWQGKAVYTKLIDCGTLPNATQKIVGIGEEYTKSIRCEGQVTSVNGVAENAKDTLPSWWDAGDYCTIYCSSLGVVLHTTQNMSNRTAVARVWYVKD